MRDFVATHGLSVTDEDPEARRVVVAGPVHALERAFSVSLTLHDDDGQAHLGHDGALWVPPGVRVVTRSVLGMDGCARLRWAWADSAGAVLDSNRRKTGAASARHLLGLPDGFEGRGFEVGIVDLGAVAGESTEAIGLTRSITDAAPAARVVVYRGGPTPRDMVDIVLVALRSAPPAVLLIGWGAPESGWSGAAIRTFDHVLLSAAALGVTVICSCRAGQAWFPATSPHVLACAPADRLSGSGRKASSAVFAVPIWQEPDGSVDPTAGRTTPDLLIPVRSGGRDTLRTTRLGVGAAGHAAGVVAAVAAGVGARPGLLMPLLARFDVTGSGAGMAAERTLLAERLLTALGVGGGVDAPVSDTASHAATPTAPFASRRKLQGDSTHRG